MEKPADLWPRMRRSYTDAEVHMGRDRIFRIVKNFFMNGRIHLSRHVWRIAFLWAGFAQFRHLVHLGDKLSRHTSSLVQTGRIKIHDFA